MQTYISILRGINVSGHKLIKMASLQKMYQELGFRNVRTYIQSGNVVFETAQDDCKTLEKTISRAILESFTFDVPVIVITAAGLQSIATQNPFLIRRKEDLLKFHVTFLSGEPDKRLVEALNKETFFPDEFFIMESAVYLLCPNGYGNTKLSNTFFEKKLKVQATTRNWKTVMELVKMVPLP